MGNPAKAEVSEETGTTVEHENLVEALTAVIAEMPAIEKSNEMKDGPGYRYRSIEQIVPVVARLFAKHQIVVIPRVLDRIDTVHSTKNSDWKHVKLLVEFTVAHVSGDHPFVGSAWGEGVDPMDKATNKAHTGAYKNFLIELLHVNDGSDPDYEQSVEAPREASAAPVLPGEAVADIAERIGALDDDALILRAWATIGKRALKALPADWEQPIKAAVDKLANLALQAEAENPNP